MSFAGRLWIGAGDERRRSERRTVVASSTLRAGPSRPHDIRVIDVSSHGLRCTCPVELAEGERVRVGLGGAGRAEAVVRWYEEGVCGMEFVRPLGPGRLAAAFVGRTVLPWVGAASPDDGGRRLATGPRRMIAVTLLLTLVDDLLSR